MTAQQQARRNAMVASTACAQRRIEREEVHDFLTARASSTEPEPTAVAVETSHPSRANG